jgi:translation initiation factor IF-2
MMTLLVLLEWLGTLYEADALVADGMDDAIVEMYRECQRSKRHATEVRKPPAAAAAVKATRAGDVHADESGYEDAPSWLRGDGVRDAGAWFGRWLVA